ncbi:MAG: hypothetical protein KBT35_00285 [Firmicutes bacterium]|nr:hypothetical protein [Candidatus Colivicinus equi]
MTLDEFALAHSKLIEQYQLIEYHLEGLFGIAGSGDFEELTRRVENDTMGELIRKVKFIFHEKKIYLLDINDFESLEVIRNDRNYWCHQCYLDIKAKENIEKITNIKNDYDLVYGMNQKLREVFKTIKG